MKTQLGNALLGAAILGCASICFAATPAEANLAAERSSFATVGGHRVHYISIGSGPQTVAFIHGWAGSVDTWRFQVPALKDRARILLIDLPGHGKSDKPETAYTMEMFANAIDAVLRDAKVEKAVLAGFSMGAPVMCRFYKQHPDKVQALVAVDGALRPFPMTDERREQFLAPYRGDGYAEAAARFIGAMFPNAGTEALRDRVLDDVRRTPRHVMLGAFEGLFDSEAWAPKKIEVPLLVVNARSPYWTEDYESFVKQLQPKAEYNVVEGTGHFLMLEKPAEFNRILTAFIEKNGGAAGGSSSDRLLNALTPEERAEGWQLLFDGESLKGWRSYGKKAPPGAGWKVENGVLKKIARVRSGDIITEAKFNDFDLRWEWRLDPRANNGLKYLVTEARSEGPGHEFQLIDDAGYPGRLGAKQSTASFYDVLPPSKKPKLQPAGSWNESRLLIKGNHVEHWVNGEKVLEYELGSPEVKAAVAQSKFKDAPGFGEKISGHIMLTDHGDECWFRNLRIREIK